MGSKVSICPPKNVQTLNMKNLIMSSHALRELFCDIVVYSRPNVRKDRTGMNDKLAIEELLLYLTKDVNPVLTQNLVANSLVTMAAYDFACNGKTKGKASKITEKQFRKFMEGMFLFSHLWELFIVSDDNVQDEIIFFGEFTRAKEKMSKMKGFTFNEEMSDEEWAKVFRDIDKSSDNEISFMEVCRYVTRNVVKPCDYLASGISQPSEIRHTVSDRKGLRRFKTKRVNTMRVIALIKQLSFKIDGDVYAVDIDDAEANTSFDGEIFDAEENKSTQSCFDDCGTAASRISCASFSDFQNEPTLPGRVASMLSQNEDGTQSLILPESANEEELENQELIKSQMDMYTVVRRLSVAHRLKSDLEATRKRLLRSREMSSDVIPHHKKSEKQIKVDNVKLSRVASKNKVSQNLVQNLSYSNNSHTTFASKFPDLSKLNNHKKPPEGPPQHPDIDYIYVTERPTPGDDEDFNDFGKRTQSSDSKESLPSNRQSASVLSVKVPADPSGSVYTNANSYNQISFNRDTCRRPDSAPSLSICDNSVALGSPMNDEMTLGDTDSAAGDSRKSHFPATKHLDGPRPKSSSAIHRKGSESRHPKTAYCHRTSSAPPTSTMQAEIDTILREHLRPESAPSRSCLTSRINLDFSESDQEKLERKYHRPSKNLSYYIKQAKTSPKKKHNSLERVSYRAVRHPPPVAATPPIYHSWMMDENFVENRTYRREKPPMPAKKARAIASLKKRKMSPARFSRR